MGVGQMHGCTLQLYSIFIADGDAAVDGFKASTKSILRNSMSLTTSNTAASRKS